MVFRILCNYATDHLQWIVATDDKSNRPLMLAGPFTSQDRAVREAETMIARRRRGT